jgi:hypothetical protein
MVSMVLILGTLLLGLMRHTSYSSIEKDNVRVTVDQVYVHDGQVRLHVRLISDEAGSPPLELGRTVPIYAAFFDEHGGFLLWSVALVDGADARPSFFSKRVFHALAESTIEFALPEGAFTMTVQLPTLGNPTSLIPLKKASGQD